MGRRGRMTWNDCVKVDMKSLCLVIDDTQNRNINRTDAVPSSTASLRLGGCDPLRIAFSGR